MIFLIFYYTGVIHQLPSFPTRRSSDLFVVTDPSGRPARLEPYMGMAGHAMITRDDGVTRHRSEEHTSELQSHSDLVCRLLLEKKKNKDMWNVNVKFNED